MFVLFIIKLICFLFAGSAAEDEEETGAGLAQSAKSDFCIEMSKSDTTTTCLLERPPVIDKKVKVS